MDAATAIKISSERFAREIPCPKKSKPFVGDDGIYIPCAENPGVSRCLITRELFVEAYNKWIKPQKQNFVRFGEDTAEEWCE